DRQGLAKLGVFPESCHWVAGELLMPPNAPFLVGSQGQPDGSERFLAFGGHSAFINSSMIRGDNDNVIFASNCVRWLADAGDGRKRKHVLFVEDGKPVPTFEDSLYVPLPSLFVWAMNNALYRIDQDNAINEALSLVPRPWLLRGALIAGTVLL